jgi:hypothetical protein
MIHRSHLALGVSALFLAMPLGCSSEDTPSDQTGGQAGVGGATAGTGAGTAGASAGTAGAGVGGAVGGAAGSVGATGGMAGSVGATGGVAGTVGTPGGAAGTTGGVAGTVGVTGGAGGTAGDVGAGAGGTAGTAGDAGTGGTAGSTAGTGGSAPSGDCDVWVAPTGTATGAGTEADPADIMHGYDLLCPPPPSGTANGAACLGTKKNMCFMSGTYALATRFELKKTRMGTADRILTLRAAPNATTRPVLDFSSQPRVACGDNPEDGNLGGITMNADYVAIKGLEVMGANDNCIKVQGSHGSVENVVVHHCADTGLQISNGSGFEGSGTNNLILNTDSHTNYDPQCEGENADGFGAKEQVAEGNVFRGCRAWGNVDDGWDFYAWISVVELENCWAFSNGADFPSAGEQDGNGFKLGGDDLGANHQLTDCIAVDNRMAGFTNNSGPDSTCQGCVSCGNADADQGVSGVSGSGCPSVAQLSAARGADGSLPSVP